VTAVERGSAESSWEIGGGWVLEYDDRDVVSSLNSELPPNDTVMQLTPMLASATDDLG
jgi:hypothetical protein